MAPAAGVTFPATKGDGEAPHHRVVQLPAKATVAFAIESDRRSIKRFGNQMKFLLFIFLTASICYGQFDNRLKSIARAEAPAVDINRMFESADWQIRISDPKVKRIDLKFTFQEQVVAETWLFDDQADPERILDIAVGPLRDIDFGHKWRIYTGIRGRSAWWNKTVDIPKDAIGKKSSYSAGPILQNDGSFGLIFFDIPTDDGIVRTPLKVYCSLSNTKEKAEPSRPANPTPPGTSAAEQPRVPGSGGG